MVNSRVEAVMIKRNTHGTVTELPDHLAVEEPLEIQLAFSNATGRLQKNIAVTMRTPGHDNDLAAGFLFTEAIIRSAKCVAQIKQPGGDANRVLVELKPNVLPSLKNSERNFYTTSSCGICGKSSIDAITQNSTYAELTDSLVISPTMLNDLPAKLRKQQEVFTATGGIHACGLFDTNGGLLLMREDVGRHNALDKLVGAAMMEIGLPLNQHILLLSGRASFELVQKAAMAGIRLIAAVGAPSSLAVEMAVEAHITLIGFLREKGFNIYSHPARVLD